MSEDTSPDSSRPEGRPAIASERLTEYQQWTLICVLAVCVLGFPLAILLWPPTILSYRDAFLGLAMIPGVLLGITGIWLAFGGRE